MQSQGPIPGTLRKRRGGGMDRVEVREGSEEMEGGREGEMWEGGEDMIKGERKGEKERRRGRNGREDSAVCMDTTMCVLFPFGTMMNIIQGLPPRFCLFLYSDRDQTFFIGVTQMAN